MSGQRLSVEPHGLPFGEDASGRMVAVADVERGLACGLVCPHCRSRLVAKKGDVIAHHLAHEADMACAGAYETALHKMAKQIITDAGTLRLPHLVAWLGSAHKTVQMTTYASFDRVEMEVWLDGMRPDIVGYKQHCAPIAVEILVTHGCGPEKVSLFRSKKLGAIEIDLSGLDRDITADKLKPIVLTSAPRHWVFHPGREAALAQLRAEQKAREEEAARAAALAEAERARIIHAEAEIMFKRLADENRQWVEERRKREEENSIYIEAAKRRYEELEKERLEALKAKKRCDAAKVTLIKKALYAHADAMVGNVFALRFMAAAITTRSGRSLPPPHWMEDPETEPYYWDHLHRTIDAIDRAEKTMAEVRDTLSKQAAQAFRSEERANLWFRSKHPALGMVSPSQACIVESGMSKCLDLLRKVAA